MSKETKSVLRKMRGKAARPVDMQIIRWRKSRKAKGALKDSKTVRAKPVDPRKSFFTFDDND